MSLGLFWSSFFVIWKRVQAMCSSRQLMANCVVILASVCLHVSLPVSTTSAAAAVEAPLNGSSNSSRCTLLGSTCGRCIAAGCHWCQQLDFGGIRDRCRDTPLSLVHSGCPADQIHQSNATIVLLNNTLPRSANTSRDAAVQLAPQNVTVRLAPNRPFTFPVTFRQAENYPVDLYFLMDVSRTMEEFAKTLVNVTETLVGELSRLTNDYRLGFGAFVDKVGLEHNSVEQAGKEEINVHCQCILMICRSQTVLMDFHGRYKFCDHSTS